MGSVLLQRPCPQGWGPWPGSSLGTGAPRSQALGPPSWGLRQGWCGPRFAGGRRGRGAGTAQRPPAAVVRPGESALCWAGPGLLDVGQEVSSRCQAASGLRVSAWLQQGLPGPPLATCSERPSGAPSPPLSALALGCADRIQGRLGEWGTRGRGRGLPEEPGDPPTDSGGRALAEAGLGPGTRRELSGEGRGFGGTGRCWGGVNISLVWGTALDRTSPWAAGWRAEGAGWGEPKPGAGWR